MMFSIIIPTHNSNDTLRIALRSCLNQTNGDFEIIVIDDASNEPAAIVCADLEDRRITCLTNPTNLGASTSRNRGLDTARGDYIVFLDADDIYLPHKLEVLARTIQREQPGVLLHRQFRLHGKSDGRISWSELPARRWDGQTPLEEFTFRGGDYYNINVLCVSRLILQNVRFRPEIRMLEDQAFVYDCLRAAQHIAVLDDLLAVYVDDSRSSRASRRYRSRQDFLAFQRYAQQHLTLRGQALINAAIASELNAFTHPVLVPFALFRGMQAGMPLGRSTFYAFRSIVGLPLANKVLSTLRAAKSKPRAPEWLDLLEPLEEGIKR